ncbi:unnamed protein product [Lota lota]
MGTNLELINKRPVALTKRGDWHGWEEEERTEGVGSKKTKSEDKELELGLPGLVPGGTVAAVQTDAPSRTCSQKSGKGYPAPSGTQVLELFPGFCRKKAILDLKSTTLHPFQSPISKTSWDSSSHEDTEIRTNAPATARDGPFSMDAAIS